jgi:predicted metal-binding membrane protein
LWRKFNTAIDVVIGRTVEPSSLETLLKQDKTLILTGILLITSVAWVYMAYEAHAMYQTGICQCAGMKLSGPDLAPWSIQTLAPLFLMWAEMMVAMMLPSAAPMILTFALVNRKRREQARPYVPSAIFAAGYLLAWTGFSAVAATAQWFLHGKALLSDVMVSRSPGLAGGLLVAAGIFQWTPFKKACLVHCRSPLSFLMTDWREGRWGALEMGLKHGAYCTGCCWVLMMLLFVAGVMNIFWIAIISLLVLAEKAAPNGLAVGKIVGAALILWGLWQFLPTGG